MENSVTSNTVTNGITSLLLSSFSTIFDSSRRINYECFLAFDGLNPVYKDFLSNIFQIFLRKVCRGFDLNLKV
jgi:hypothetical protein